MPKPATNSDFHRAGRRLRFRFTCETPRLTAIEFQWSANKKGARWNEVPDNTHEKSPKLDTPLPSALADFFVACAEWDAGEQKVSFSYADQSKAETIRNARDQTGQFFHKVFITEGPNSCFKNLFTGTGLARPKKSRTPNKLPRPIVLRPDQTILPADCLEIVWDKISEVPLKSAGHLCQLLSALRGEIIIEPQDKKIVVIASEIREKLLTGQPPSLLKCFESSNTQLLGPGGKFGKHFVGVAAVLTVKLRDREQPVILGYPRQSKDGLTEPREGWSILFHASFDLGIHGHPGRADKWVDLANENPRRGREKFMRIPGGTLLELISYKVDLTGKVKGTCRPLGVITRDLRDEPRQRRVYTQYVFQAEISLPRANTMKELERVAARLETQLNSPVSPSQEELEPEVFLSGRSVRTMDYLALRALRGNEDTITYEDSRFTRDFAIL